MGVGAAVDGPSLSMPASSQCSSQESTQQESGRSQGEAPAQREWGLQAGPPQAPAGRNRTGCDHRFSPQPQTNSTKNSAAATSPKGTLPPAALVLNPPAPTFLSPLPVRRPGARVRPGPQPASDTDAPTAPTAPWAWAGPCPASPWAAEDAPAPVMPTGGQWQGASGRPARPRHGPRALPHTPPAPSVRLRAQGQAVGGRGAVRGVTAAGAPCFSWVLRCLSGFCRGRRGLVFLGDFPPGWCPAGPEAAAGVATHVAAQACGCPEEGAPHWGGAGGHRSEGPLVLGLAWGGPGGAVAGGGLARGPSRRAGL